MMSTNWKLYLTFQLTIHYWSAVPSSGHTYFLKNSIETLIIADHSIRSQIDLKLTELLMFNSWRTQISDLVFWSMSASDKTDYYCYLKTVMADDWLLNVIPSLLHSSIFSCPTARAISWTSVDWTTKNLGSWFNRWWNHAHHKRKWFILKFSCRFTLWNNVTQWNWSM